MRVDRWFICSATPTKAHQLSWLMACCFPMLQWCAAVYQLSHVFLVTTKPSLLTFICRTRQLHNLITLPCLVSSRFRSAQRKYYRWARRRETGMCFKFSFPFINSSPAFIFPIQFLSFVEHYFYSHLNSRCQFPFTFCSISETNRIQADRRTHNKIGRRD